MCFVGGESPISEGEEEESKILEDVDDDDDVDDDEEEEEEEEESTIAIEILRMVENMTCRMLEKLESRYSPL